MTAPAIEGIGLVHRYGSVVAVDGVSLQAHSGEVLGLLGPNGAGKSTAFKILAGLIRPDRGSVRLGDVDVTRWPLHARARAGLAYLPQHPSVIGRLTCEENVAVALHAVGRPRSDAIALLDAEDLASKAAARASSLSGGQRRRLEIARSLALRPNVVLLDEPFAGVDPAHIKALRERIRKLAADGIAVVLTDHQVREALPTCDRAIVLDGGIVQVNGSPEAVAADPVARARYLGEGFRLD